MKRFIKIKMKFSIIVLNFILMSSIRVIDDYLKNKKIKDGEGTLFNIGTV